MAVAIEQFVKQLEESGILASDTLMDFLPPKGQPKNAEELARDLVRRKKLTKFQATELFHGRGKSLILDNYVLLEKIGQGGMGQVFKARHRRMDRVVAVKILPAHMMKEAATVARFEREVRAAARITHPNIVTAFDAGHSGNVHFLVMECVDGSDLSALVKKQGPFQVDQAVNYILQTARGLDAAHAEGIVHRDIKPGNLLLDKNQTVKILDMGLARIHGESAGQAELTATGAVMGTIDYMAPEQALSTKTADARADVYSLGCSLYYLLTGKAVFDGETLMAKLLAHREQPIPTIREIRPEVPEAVERIFNRMVAKQITERYQSMREVIADLESLAGAESPPSNSMLSAGSISDTNMTNFLRDISLAEELTGQRRKQAPAQPAFWATQRRPWLIAGGVLGGLVMLAVIVGSLMSRSRSPVSSRQGTAEKEQKSPAKNQSTAEAKGAQEMSWNAPEFQDWVREAAGLPAEQQLAAVSQKLVEQNPGFDGKFTQQEVDREIVTRIAISSDYVTDLSPLRAFEGLNALLLGCQRLKDLRPLQGMKLKALDCSQSAVSDLSPLKGMPLTYLFVSSTRVRDLSPLVGMPLLELNISGTQVTDLAPLKGMPLRFLRLQSTNIADLSALKGMAITNLALGRSQVRDLTPLRGMPLTSIGYEGTSVADLSPLQEMPLTDVHCDYESNRDEKFLRSLKTLLRVNSIPAADFWKQAEKQRKRGRLGFEMPGFDRWVKETAEQPPERQLRAVSKKLIELNPGFDGKLAGQNLHDTPTVVYGVVTRVRISSDKVKDLSPLRALTGLTELAISRGILSDLSPLRGLPLTSLELTFQPNLTDISPLQGMPLKRLILQGSNVSDISALNGMPLTMLGLRETAVTDLSPLAGMPLTHLDCFSLKISDLSPLAGMPLTKFTTPETSDLSVVRDMPLTLLEIKSPRVSDLTPISNLPLTELTIIVPQNIDLTPLAELKLNSLILHVLSVSDLSPLRGMPIQHLMILSAEATHDFMPLAELPLEDFTGKIPSAEAAEILRSIKTLRKINDKPADEFWKNFVPEAGQR